MGPNPILQKKKKFGQRKGYTREDEHTQDKNHMRTGPGEKAVISASQGGWVELRRNETCRHLDLGPVASRTMRKLSVVLATQSVVFYYSSHRKLIYVLI